MTLQYRENGTFKIMQLTDTHVGNRPYNKEDLATFQLVKDALAHTDADLIIHTGDIIWSDGVQAADDIFREFISLFNEVDVPVAITLGNHDAEGEFTRADLREMFAATVLNPAEKTNVFLLDDRESYTLEIFDQELKEVESVIYLLDSGGDAPLTHGIYDWNQPEQVNWFSEISRIYRKGDGVKRNLVFQHIPVPEYWQAADEILAGVNNETNERISAPHVNTGLFANMLLDGETWGMFVGHDHENNFVGMHQGLHLVYGNVSGYNTYGDMSRGVRMIELNQKTQAIETYIVKEYDFTQKTK